MQVSETYMYFFEAPIQHDCNHSRGDVSWIFEKCKLLNFDSWTFHFPPANSKILSWNEFQNNNLYRKFSKFSINFWIFKMKVISLIFEIVVILVFYNLTNNNIFLISVLKLFFAEPIKYVSSNCLRGLKTFWNKLSSSFELKMSNIYGLSIFLF